MFTHVVLFKLHDRSPEAIEAARAVLASMAGAIPELRAVEVGVDALHTQRSLDLALVTRFDSRADYEVYRTHPYHVDPVLKHMHSAAAEAVIVDFES